jgi:cyclic pyranopterin phosphate synthase
MDNLKFWKILRVLTTNVCNYRCIFCHNEGQQTQAKKEMLPFDGFKIVIEALKGTHINDIQFSGGEPFLNPDTLKMIQYVDNYTDYEIGCATNATLLDEAIVEQLSKTRIKLNLQFPAINDEDFSIITKTGKLIILLEKIRLLEENNISFGLNHCFTGSDFDKIITVIDFAQKHNLPLKLLPNVKNEYSIQLKEQIFSYLDEILNSKINPHNGSIKWKSKSNFQVKYVDAPCFYRDFEKCKSYAEIRLLPDMSIQPCILKSTSFDESMSIKSIDSNSIKNKFQEVWNSFIEC